MPNFFQYPQPDLRGAEKCFKKGRTSGEVTFSVSYRYNGGILIDAKGRWVPISAKLPPGTEHYDGYHVPDPILPDGYELVTMGVGLQLNARPPYATMLLRKKQNLSPRAVPENAGLVDNVHGPGPAR